jgi:galactitol-specific phosphotransferase system IIB component
LGKQINVKHNNNSIQLFVIYVPSQQLQGQLQTQHSAVIGNYIMDKQHMVKDKLQEHINAEKQTP